MRRNTYISPPLSMFGLIFVIAVGSACYGVGEAPEETTRVEALTVTRANVPSPGGARINTATSVTSVHSPNVGSGSASSNSWNNDPLCRVTENSRAVCDRPCRSTDQPPAGIGLCQNRYDANGLVFCDCGVMPGGLSGTVGSNPATTGTSR